MRRYIAGLQTTALIEAICSFFNSLLGSDSSPQENASSTKSDSPLPSPAKLRAEVLSEVAMRYRYSPSASCLDADLARHQLLRELCLANGIQLALRSYDIASPSSPPPQTNGHVNGRSEHAPTIITPEDILNVHPVVKKAPYRVSRPDFSSCMHS